MRNSLPSGSPKALERFLREATGAVSGERSGFTCRRIASVAVARRTTVASIGTARHRCTLLNDILRQIRKTILQRLALHLADARLAA